MNERRLRLGDILDDYCPRERRITNHAVVAMIDDEVKQTRCTTCDADHDYKQARIPPQRRKKLDAAAGEPGVPVRLRPTDEEAPADEDILDDEAVVAGETSEGDAQPGDMFAAATDGSDENGDEPAPPSSDEDGPVHRRLIRATLPRPEGQLPERKEPEFTVRQPGMRGPDGRKGRPGGGRRGMRAPEFGSPRQGSGQGQRFGGPRQGPGQPPRQGSGHAPRHGSGQGNRPAGNRQGPSGNPRGPGGGRGGRKRGR
jgi:hypothetical protein